MNSLCITSLEKWAGVQKKIFSVLTQPFSKYHWVCGYAFTQKFRVVNPIAEEVSHAIILKGVCNAICFVDLIAKNLIEADVLLLCLVVKSRFPLTQT